jgi:hypothetical protein
VTLLGPGPAIDVRDAYRHCERVTRQQAKNFFYGIALLPAEKRRALCAVYAFARRIDDIGDGTMAAGDKLAALERARADVSSLAAGSGLAGDDPVMTALRDAAARFPIPVAAFGELIDGCVADVRGASYMTFDDLRGYGCRSAFSVAAARLRPSRWPTRLELPCSSPTSSGMSGRISATAGFTCRQRTWSGSAARLSRQARTARLCSRAGLTT